MSWAVPPVGDNVATAAKGQLIVDDHELLMMTGPEREIVSFAELDSRPSERPLCTMAADILMSHDAERRFPHQYAHIQRGPGVDQPNETSPDLIGIVRALGSIRSQPRARIKRPAQNVD